jgi:hypothetical protein
LFFFCRAALRNDVRIATSIPFASERLPDGRQSIRPNFSKVSHLTRFAGSNIQKNGIHREAERRSEDK